jgi:hypothetical protein
LGIHYLLRFWVIDNAYQPDVSAMFGEYYEFPGILNQKRFSEKDKRMNNNGPKLT